MSSRSSADEWASLHIFYNGDLDALLTIALRPALMEMRRTGVITRGFFLRYWNGGPHIRLRLAPTGTGDSAIGSVRDAVTSFVRLHPAPPLTVDEYERRIAGVRAIEDTVHQQCGREPEAAEPLQPQNAVQVRPYRFDAQRYGRDAAAVVERHFCRSSEAAMFIVSETMNEPAQRLTLALHLVAAAVPAMALDLCAAVRLFRRTSGAMRTLLAPAVDAVLPDDESYGPLDDLAAQLRGERPLAGQSASVNKLLAVWEDELRLRHGQLHALRRDGASVTDASYVILDFLHLMNNRLGIGLSEEWYLSHLVSGALAHQLQ
jgi:thiopeptide-type bacteriocin biosynthesis protein